jgi:hypothetical protein
MKSSVRRKMNVRGWTEECRRYTRQGKEGISGSTPALHDTHRELKIEER